MPILRNPRHEAFAQAFTRGEYAANSSACYRLVYGKDDGAAASRLQRRDDILQRITEIRAEITAQDTAALQQATEKLGITKEWVLQVLVDNIDDAKDRADGSTINKAAELLGKHLGMFHAPASEALNVNVGLELVDRPPREDYQQWVDRRRQELTPKPKPIVDERAFDGNGRQIPQNGQGNGKAH